LTWNQTYLLFGHGLGFSCLLATLPILTLLVMVAVWRKPAWIAGLAGLAVTFLLAMLGYHMPIGPALSAAANGAVFGLFPITWIIFWAIALFRVTVETGQFEIIKDSIGKLTPDRRIQALLIAFCFGAFLEGAAGFGTPVAIAATMLIGLGFSPFRASAICLLANTAPVAFGSIGIPIVTLAGITGLPLDKLSTAIGLISTPLTLLIPIYIVVAVGGLSAMSGIWLPVLLTSVVYSAVQLAVSVYLGPQLTDILASLAAIVALVVLLRRWRVRLPGSYPGAATSAALMRFAGAAPGVASAPESSVKERDIPEHSLRTLMHAWTPYGLLVACVLLWGWTPVQKTLSRATIVIHWPLLHDVVQRMPPIVPAASPYHALFTLNWLAAAGTACMFATLLSVAYLRFSLGAFLRILLGIVHQLILPTATVSSVLAIAFLMNYCGATATLGLGFAAAGALFPFFSALLGWIGVFLTGSDTSSNALFGNLQVVTAMKLGFSPVMMAGANSVGGVMGKMISLQTIAIAAAATGLTQLEQVKLFRFTLRHSLLLAFLTGGVSLLYAYVFHFR
jgi:lactate permease